MSQTSVCRAGAVPFYHLGASQSSGNEACKTRVFLLEKASNAG